MRTSSAFAAGLISAMCLMGSAHAQQVSTVVYICNIEGAQAELTAQVQAVNSAGVFMDSSGMFGGSVSTGEVRYYYQGTLISQTGGRYSFTGENAFADFLDLNTNDRFRVQMNVQGQMLQLIINPQGPGPVQYFCQLAGRQ
jgi:hypothetical protein